MLRGRLTDFPSPASYPRLADSLTGDAVASDEHHESMRRWMNRIVESIQTVLVNREKRFEEVKRALSRLES